MIYGGGREECGKMKNRRVRVHLRIAQQEQLVFHMIPFCYRKNML